MGSIMLIFQLFALPFQCLCMFHSKKKKKIFCVLAVYCCRKIQNRITEYRILGSLIIGNWSRLILIYTDDNIMSRCTLEFEL